MFKISIFDRYIFKQVFLATFVCLLLFTIIWIAPEILVRIIRNMFLHGMSIYDAAKALLFELPKVIGKAIPVGILLGSLFTFDKLSKDSELSILRGIGLSYTRIMAPVLFLGIILSFACFYVNDVLVPCVTKAGHEWAHYEKHFVFIEKNPDKTPKTGIVVSNFQGDFIKDLIILNFSNEKYDDAMTFKSIVFAPYALAKKDCWLLPEAKEYIIDKKGVYKDINDVKDYKILKGEVAVDVLKIIVNAAKKERYFTTAEFREYMDILKRHDFMDDYKYVLTKYYQRYLHPLTCILFAALGCLLGFSPPRSQRLIGFTIAVGMIFLYYITLPFFDLMAQKGAVWPFLAASFPLIAFLAAIFVIKKVKDL